ncbi:MAG: carboxypeptidase-like regulatory domain-containing protein [Cyclobacteriaceae bacterium]|nr:carboxypeptidase-like regulatory domain-containing protein [Cyclobacteriaceae bacterium]
MKRLKSLILQSTLLLLTFPVFGQERIHLSGTVTNAHGEPLPFANVSINKGMTGTITNQEGKFTLTLAAVQRPDTLCVSHIGYNSFCENIEMLLSKQSVTITLSEYTTTISEVVVESKKLPTADQIISQVRKNLKRNYPSTPFKLKSFYRQSKLVNGEYASLQEAAVDVYAKDHKPSGKQFTDEVLIVNEFRKSQDYFDREFDALLDPPVKINPVKGVLLQNGIKYIKHNNVLLRRDYQLDSIVQWQGKEHYIVSLPEPNSVTLYIDSETYAIKRFENAKDLTQSQTIIDKIHRDSLKSKLKNVSFSMEFREIEGKFYPFFLEFVVHASVADLNHSNIIYNRVVTQQLLVTDIQTRNVVLPSIKEQTENTIFDNLQLKYDANFWNNYNIIQLTPIEEKLLGDLQKELSLEEQFNTASISSTVEPKTLLKPQESKADFLKFRTILEEVHTGLNAYISHDKWNLLMDSLYRSLNEPKSWDEFYKLVSYSIAQVGNGHTEAILPAWWYQMKRAVFPVRVQYIQGKLIVEECFDPDLQIPKGSEIASINGHLVENIRRQVWPLLSADGFRSNYKYNWLGLVYATYLAFVLESPHEYAIEYITPDQENKIVKHPGLQTSLKSFYESLISEDMSKNYDHKLEINAQNQYAWLDIRESSSLTDSIENYFKTIRDSGVQNLVIDLRTHLGLMEDCDPSMLYSYFVDKAFRFFEYMRVKSNNYAIFDNDFTYAPYATSLKEIKEEYFDKLKGTTDGYFLWEGEPCSGFSDPGKYLFKGNVYILVSGFTFSASADFASKMSQLSNVTIIGQETGGTKYSFVSGFMPRLILPNSGITVRVPTWQSKVCCPQSEKITGQGVIPDHEVDQTIADFIAGKDTVKEYVMKLLTK